MTNTSRKLSIRPAIKRHVTHILVLAEHGPSYWARGDDAQLALSVRAVKRSDAKIRVPRVLYDWRGTVITVGWVVVPHRQVSGMLPQFARQSGVRVIRLYLKSRE